MANPLTGDATGRFPIRNVTILRHTRCHRAGGTMSPIHTAQHTATKPAVTAPIEVTPMCNLPAVSGSAAIGTA